MYCKARLTAVVDQTIALLLPSLETLLYARVSCLAFLVVSRVTSVLYNRRLHSRECSVYLFQIFR